MKIDDVFEADFIGNQDTDTHRVCGTCGILKPVQAFYKDGCDRKGNTRYRRDCKECYKVQRILEAKMKEKKVSKCKN